MIQRTTWRSISAARLRVLCRLATLSGHWHFLGLVTTAQTPRSTWTVLVANWAHSALAPVRLACRKQLDDRQLAGSRSVALHGTLDEPAIWDRALSAAEIAGLYRVGIQTASQPMVARQDAADVPYTPGASYLSSTDVQAALDEASTYEVGVSEALSNHEANDPGSHIASAISFSPGAILATDVQAAIEEVYTGAETDIGAVAAELHAAIPVGGTPAVVLGTAAAAGSSPDFLRRDDTIVGFDATVPVTQAFGDAAATGSIARAARRDHKHGMPAAPAAERAAASTTPAAIGTAAVGVGTTDARADHVHATGAGTPTTSALADAAATGSGPAAAMTDHKHGRESFATNAVVLGSAAAAGAATTPMRSNDTIAAFDATAPSTQAFSDAAAVGTAAFAARRDHKHAMPALGVGATNAAAGNDARLSDSRTPVAHGASLHTDITRKVFLPAHGAGLDVATLVALGASPDLTNAVAYADAATQGAFWEFMVPSDWASGVITLQPVWSPGATDGVAHTVRWTITAKTVAAGTTVTAAGTAVAFTGASAARTIGVVVYDTATSTTLTPAAAGDLFRFELQRIGADAADTYVGVVNLLGVIVTYTANQ